MDSQQNKQLVMQGYQRFQNKDIPGLLDLFADDIEWIGARTEELPFAGEYHGKNEVGQYFSQLDQAQEALQFEPKDCIAEGDRVVVTGQSRWTVRSTGQTYDNPWVHVFTLRDGKVARFEQYNDTAAALKAYRPMMAPAQQSAQGATSTIH
ncbi:MAG TPA: nuclear transport factor 2 family protein [Noviherbaspirillum sp.]